VILRQDDIALNGILFVELYVFLVSATNTFDEFHLCGSLIVIP
jgi:hypothetical protein